MFGFHPLDLLIVLAIVLLLAGGKRLAGLGEALGKSVASYRRAIRGEDEQINAADNVTAAEPPLLPEGQPGGKA
jgi:sec-independent protein translocase protein TatA